VTWPRAVEEEPQLAVLDADGGRPGGRDIGLAELGQAAVGRGYSIETDVELGIARAA
jgi:hypothetical protein